MLLVCVTCFFGHNHTCGLLNISALRVKCRIQAFAKFKRPDGRYRAHITTIYYTFRPPLSQNPPSAPDFTSPTPLPFLPQLGYFAHAHFFGLFSLQDNQHHHIPRLEADGSYTLKVVPLQQPP